MLDWVAIPRVQGVSFRAFDCLSALRQGRKSLNLRILTTSAYRHLRSIVADVYSLVCQ